MNMQRQMQGPMFEWEEDNFSFEDSDRFEEVRKNITINLPYVVLFFSNL